MDSSGSTPVYPFSRLAPGVHEPAPATPAMAPRDSRRPVAQSKKPITQHTHPATDDQANGDNPSARCLLARRCVTAAKQ